MSKNRAADGLGPNIPAMHVDGSPGISRQRLIPRPTRRSVVRASRAGWLRVDPSLRLCGPFAVSRHLPTDSRAGWAGGNERRMFHPLEAVAALSFRGTHPGWHKAVNVRGIQFRSPKRQKMPARGGTIPCANSSAYPYLQALCWVIAETKGNRQARVSGPTATVDV